MLSDIYLYNLALVIALTLFWVCPKEEPAIRQRILIVVSAVAVFLFSPGGFLACLYLAIIPLIGQSVFSRKKSALLFWTFISMTVFPLVGMRLLGDFGLVITFGTAFATVKSLGLVFTAYDNRERLTTHACFLLIFFFPLFTIGPVERLSTFASDRLKVTFDADMFFKGSIRIIVGLFVILFVCNDILAQIRDVWLGNNQAAIESADQLEIWALIYVSFAFTYLNFIGFSEVAIGTSALFGLKVVENFDRPLLAQNLAEFWKRYHISMGNWINQFLFFPLAIFFKKPWAIYPATIIAFVLFGLWHEFTVQYFIWGIANGFGVSLINFMRQKKLFPINNEQNIIILSIRRIFGIFLTVTFISWIQTFANLENLATSFAMTRGLFGF